MVLLRSEQSHQKDNLEILSQEVFRLEKEQALINRLGFNNHGSEISFKENRRKFT